MKVLQYTVSAQTLLHTEELICWATIYSSIMDSLVASLIERIPVEDREAGQDYVQRLSWKKGMGSVVMAVSSFHLVRRDVALGQLLLQDKHLARARTAPFGGASLVGPDPKEFDSKIFAMREQHSLHRGLTSHFKVPKNAAPKSVSQKKASVHQRLDPPVGQEARESFRPGQQSKLNKTFFPLPSKTDLWTDIQDAKDPSQSFPRRRLNQPKVPPDDEMSVVGAHLVFFPSNRKTC